MLYSKIPDLVSILLCQFLDQKEIEIMSLQKNKLWVSLKEKVEKYYISPALFRTMFAPFF